MLGELLKNYLLSVLINGAQYGHINTVKLNISQIVSGSRIIAGLQLRFKKQYSHKYVVVLSKYLNISILFNI